MPLDLNNFGKLDISEDVLPDKTPLEQPAPAPEPRQSEAPLTPSPGADVIPLKPQDLPDHDTPISRAYKPSAKVSPDDAAKYLKLSERTGQRPEAIQNNETLRALAQHPIPNQQELDKLYPGLAEFLAVPRNAAVAKDDLLALGFFERKARLIKESVLGAYYTNELGMALDRKYYGGQDTPENDAEIARLRAANKRTLMPNTSFEKALSSATQFLGQSAMFVGAGVDEGLAGAMVAGSAAAIAGQIGPQIAVPEEIVTVPAAATTGFFVGMAQGAASYMGKVTRGLNADTFMNQYGIPRDKAILLAGWEGGLVEPLLEMVGGVLAARMIPGARQIISKSVSAGMANALGKPAVRSSIAQAGRDFTVGVLGETTEEVLQQIAQELAGNIGQYSEGKINGADIVKNIDWKGVGEIARQTALGVGLMGGVALPFNYISYARAINPSAPALATAVQESLQDSKLAERSPEIFEEYIDKVRQKTGGPDRMFLNAGAIEELFQSGKASSDEVSEVLDKLGVKPEDYQEAVALGMSISFDTKKVGELMRSQLGEKVKSKLAFMPDVPDKAILDDMMRRNEVEWPTEDVLKAKQGLMAAGRPEADADLGSRLLGARARVWALQTGQAPGEYFSRYVFQQGEQGAAQGRDVLDANSPRTLFQSAKGIKINPDELSREVLSRMNRTLKSKGYDVRGTADIKKLLKTRGLINDEGYLWQPDWVNAYEKATGSVSKRKETAQKTKNAKEDYPNIDWKRLKELGKTNNLNEAGYIAPNGDMIDLSGKREGGPRGSRALDHREVGGTDGMQEMTAYGYIRMDARAGIVDIAKEPSAKQYGVLQSITNSHNGEVTIELNDGLGEYTGEYYRNPERHFYQEYPQGTKPARIMADIKRFYAGEDPVPLRTLFQSAFHGSPYKFDKFSLEHMGKGEGAQAYGWGMYFAGKKEVAEFYREKLAGFGVSGNLSVDGQEVEKVGDEWHTQEGARVNDAILLALYSIEEWGGIKHPRPARAAAGLREGWAEEKKYPDPSIKIGPFYWDETEVNAALAVLDRGQINISSAGQLYEVEIPDADVLLDWDKPLSEQPEGVKKALEKAGFVYDQKPYIDALALALQNDESPVDLPKEPKNPSGQEIYNQIGERGIEKLDESGMAGWTMIQNTINDRVVNQRAASEYLNSLGIKGIRYLDGSSRGKGEGSYNYVIFDDSAIEVLNTFYQGNRGSVTFQDAKAIISFFETADPSTAPHEIFHVFRRELEMLAMDPAPTTPGYEYVKEQLRQDWAAASRFVGVEVGQAWTREQEEKFADAGLDYLLTGKVASPELRGILDRLRSWFVQMYQAIRDQGRVSPEMEGVFNRLVSTEQEIQLAEAEGGVAPMFETPPQGVSPEAWGEYVDQAKKAAEGLSARVMNNRIGLLNKLLPGWVQEGMAWARDREEQKLMADYVARGGLAADEVKNHLSPELYGQLVKKRVGLVKNAGTVSLEAEAMARDMDPADLADTMLKALTLKQLANEYAQRKTAEMYAELSALELGIGSEHLELLKKEIELLSQSGEQLVLQEDWAIEPLLDRASAINVSDLSPSADADIMTAIKTAALNAAQALQENNRELAAQEKNRQRQLLKRVQERARGRREIADVKKVLANQVRLKYADPQRGTGVDREFLLQARKVVGLYAPGLLTDGMKRELGALEATGEIPSLKEFLANLKADENFEHSEEILDAMPPLPVEMKTVQDWMDVKAIVQQLTTLGRNKNRLLYGQAQKSLNETVLGLVEHMADKHKAKPPKGWAAIQDRRGEFKSKFKKAAVAEFTKMQFLLRMADGWDADGPFMREIWGRVKRAEDSEITMKEKAFTDLKAIFERIPWEQRKTWRQRSIQVPGVPVNLTMEEIMMIALNSGNAGNLKALTQSTSVDYTWLASRQAHQAVLDYLDETHWQVVEDIWAFLDQFFPMLQDVHELMTGVVLPKVEPREFETRTGKHRGGYFPIISDPAFSSVTEAQQEAQASKDYFNAVFGGTTTKSGPSFARKGSRQAPLLKFQVIAQHVQAVTHDVTHRAAVRDVQKIFTHPLFRERFIEYFGKEYYDEFRPWLQNIARPEPARLLGAEGFLDFLRKNATLVGLGLKTTVVLKQPLALTQAMHQVGTRWVGKAIAQWGRNPGAMTRFVRESSPYMRDRMNSFDREAAEFVKGVKLAGPRGGLKGIADRVGVTQDEIGRLMMWPIAYTDFHASAIAWAAEYNKRIAEGRTHENAVDLADGVVTATAGSANAKDMAAIYRKKGAWRIFTMFQSFFSSSHNLFMEVARRANAGDMSPLESTVAMWHLAVLPVLLSYMTDQGDIPDEVDDFKKLGEELVGYLLGGVPLVRDVWNSASGGWGFAMTPVNDFFESTVYITSLILGKKSKFDPQTFAKHMTLILGYLTGLPARQAIVTGRGIRDLASGETENPARLILPERRERKK